MLVHAYFPLAEPRVQREARAAQEAGYDVTVIALRQKGEESEVTLDGIHVKRVRLTHRRGTGMGRMAFEYLLFCAIATWQLAIRSIRSPFDIVHVHNPPDFLVVAGLAPRARGSRLILDIHDLSSHMFAVRVPGLLGAIVSQLLVWIERASCAIVDRVITVHEPYRRVLMDRGIPAAKIHVVMNSAEDGVLERSLNAPAFTQRTTAFRLAYHGTLTSWYGADLLVEAIRELREEGLDIDAVILGDGDALPTLRSQVTEAGLESRIHFSGRYLPIEQAIATVAAADCGVIPNRPSEVNRFALSSKLFEYVAIGVPVVVARLETLASHFAPTEVTFFDPGDASSLARAIRWVYAHRDAARGKAELAKVRANQYSWSRGRDELRRVYHDLNGQGGANGSGKRGGACRSGSGSAEPS